MNGQILILLQLIMGRGTGVNNGRIPWRKYGCHQGIISPPQGINKFSTIFYLIFYYFLKSTKFFELLLISKYLKILLPYNTLAVQNKAYSWRKRYNLYALQEEIIFIKSSISVLLNLEYSTANEILRDVNQFIEFLIFY